MKNKERTGKVHVVASPKGNLCKGGGERTKIRRVLKVS